MNNETMKARVFTQDVKVFNTLLLALSLKIGRTVKTAELINALLGLAIDGNREPNQKDIERIAKAIQQGGYRRTQPKD